MTPHADLVARLEELASKNGCLSAAYENCIEQGASQSDMCLTCAAATAAKALAALPPPADPPALVALLSEYQDVNNEWHALPNECDDEKLIERINNRLGQLHERLLAYPLSAAPPVTDKE